MALSIIITPAGPDCRYCPRCKVCVTCDVLLEEGPAVDANGKVVTVEGEPVMLKRQRHICPWDR